MQTPPYQTTRRTLLPTSGFSLIEVTVALGIVSFCLLLLLAMLPAGVQSNYISFEESQATMLMTEVVQDLQTFSADTQSVLFNLNMPFSRSTGGTQVNVITGDVAEWLVSDSHQVITTTGRARHRIRLEYLQVPTQSEVNQGSRLPAEAVITITWPALAAPENASGRIDSFVAIPHPEMKGTR